MNCRTCSENKKKSYGCENETKEPILQIDGEDIYRCPLKLITEQSVDYIRFYGYYEKGYLPNAGGILDQPAKFMDAITVIENIIGEMREQKEKELKRK